MGTFQLICKTSRLLTGIYTFMFYKTDGDTLKKLAREFYSRNTLEVSKDLLSKNLVHYTGGNNIIGRIVEVEAYMGPFDKAAHSYNYRRTERNDIMYGSAGFAYVFTIYGMYFCMNVVTEGINKPEAVLIRALEPVEGIEKMCLNRYGKSQNELSKINIRNLTNGPGKLCIAMNINKTNNGDDLCGERLYITEGIMKEEFEIVTSKRINIDYAEEAIDYPWRFYIKGNAYVSKK